MTPDLSALNEQYAIPGHVSLHAGPGGLNMIVVNNAHATAAVTLAGGHVMTYTPYGQKPVLWVSPNASFEIGRAMRGGVPICWPWFAVHPTGGDAKPLHGLVRTMLWSLSGTRALDDGSSEVRMRVVDSEETRRHWPHPFELELVVTVGKRLRVVWNACNTGSQPFTYTGALHPYFHTSDIRAITIYGLDGVHYLDKIEDFQRKQQHGPVTISGWTDRIYLNTISDVVIEDAGYGRRIHIHKIGSRTTVVWNPDFKDESMSDVGAGQHKNFVCVESANASSDTVTVQPGGESQLGMEVWSEQGGGGEA